MPLIRQFFDTIVVMPIGPRCLPEHIADSIGSFIYYAKYSYKIILIDDSQKGTGLKMQERFPHADVLVTPRSMGKLCGLYISLSMAFKHALNYYRFRAVLRMDSDALIIGHAPEEKALELFRNDPRMGIAGQYPMDYNGKPWDISWPASKLKALTQTRQLVYKPLAHWCLRKLYKRARKNGYKAGESVFGGACFISETLLKELERLDLLPNYALRAVELEEDHLFAILAKAAGFELGDLSSHRLPFGCAWIGLPASPEELHAKGKKIIHSTRGWKQMKEDEIRAWFRNKRVVAEKVTA